jgi:uncharacterized metal-binding protein YceD (DUF177 family)
MTRPELHRPVRVSRIPSEGMEVVVEANEAERLALAVRMGLPAIHALRSRFVLTRQGDGIVEAVGRLEAAVVQTCVVSLEDFESPLAEDFLVNFVPEGTESDDPDPESVDEIPYGGDTIDVGEAASEQLSLALDAYPRRPDATLPETESVTDPRLAVLSAWREAKGRQ